MRLCPTRRIFGPDLGQIQAPINKRMPKAAGISGEDTDLTVLNPPGRPRILARHAGGCGSLLQEPGFIHHQHPVRIAKRLDCIASHQAAEIIGRPGGSTQKRLDAVRTLKAGLFRQHPAGLALGSRKHTIDEGACRLLLLAAPKCRRNDLSQFLERGLPVEQCSRPVRNRHTTQFPLSDIMAREPQTHINRNCSTRFLVAQHHWEEVSWAIAEHAWRFEPLLAEVT